MDVCRLLRQTMRYAASKEQVKKDKEGVDENNIGKMGTTNDNKHQNKKLDMLKPHLKNNNMLEFTDVKYSPHMVANKGISRTSLGAFLSTIQNQGVKNIESITTNRDNSRRFSQYDWVPDASLKN